MFRLKSRSPKSINESLRLIQAFENTYGCFGFEPSNKDDRQEGAYYLTRVDSQGNRSYEIYCKPKALKVEKLAESNVSWIEFQREVIDLEFVEELLVALDPERIHIISSACFNFCVGGHAEGDIILNQFLRGTSKFAELHRRLEDCKLPTMVLCNGATRGGGMLFPGIADVVVALESASFGFPEIRRGVLPGVVSISAQRRLGKMTCRQIMMTGKVFDTSTALDNGFVDIKWTGDKDSSIIALKRLATILSSYRTEDLICLKRIIQASGNIAISTIERGLISEPLRYQPRDELVTMKRYSSSIAIIELFGSPTMSWAMVCSLRNCVKELKKDSTLKAILLYAQGDDFCNGGDPVEWVNSCLRGDEQNSLEKVSAVIHQGVLTCCHLWDDLNVPVVVVLNGKVSGAGLALALSADYRIATTNAHFLLGDYKLNDVLQLVLTFRSTIGEIAWLKLSQSYYDSISSAVAMETQLVSSVHEIKEEAIAYALAMCKTIEQAPSEGLYKTIALFRLSADGKTVAERSVTFARRSIISPHEHSYVGNTIRWLECETYFLVDILSARVPLSHLYLALIDCTRKNYFKPLVITLTSLADLDDEYSFSEEMFLLLDWFSMRSRPKVIVVCDGRGLSILLAVLADYSVASETSSFRMQRLDFCVYACLLSKKGIAPCGRLLYQTADICADDAVSIGFVRYLIPKSILVSKLESIVSEVSSCSPDEAVPFSSYCDIVLHEVQRIHASPDKNPSLTLGDNGVAEIRLTTVEDLADALEILGELKYNAVMFFGINVGDKDGAKSRNIFSCIYELSMLSTINRKLDSLQVPLSIVLDGTLSPLAALVSCSCHHRIGGSTTEFDFNDDIFAEALLNVTDALLGVIGPVKTIALSLERGVMNAHEAFEIGLLTMVVEEPLLYAATNFNPVVIRRNTQMSSSLGNDIYKPVDTEPERCLDSAKRIMSSVHCKTMSEATDDSLRVQDSVIHISLQTPFKDDLFPPMLHSFDKENSIVVIHLSSNNKSHEYFAISESLFNVADSISSFLLPVIIVINGMNVISMDDLLLVSLADFIITTDETCNNILKRNQYGSKLKRFNFIISVQPEKSVNELLQNLRQLDKYLLRTIRASFPVSCLEEAELIMSGLLRKDVAVSDRDLVRLSVSESGVGVIELADAPNFNAESMALMQCLKERLCEVQRLALLGDVRCVVIQGAGPHFCTGGWSPSGESDISYESPNDIAAISDVARLIRELPIPSIAAVHGKLIGGGLALAMAADWCIAAADSTYNVGNLPRGMNPLFMLSRCLPLSIGRGPSLKLYLEDSIITNAQAVSLGLVHSTERTSADAKLAAFSMASKIMKPINKHCHGKIARICAKDRVQSSKEILSLYTSVKLQRNSISSKSVESVQPAANLTNISSKVNRVTLDHLVSKLRDIVLSLVNTEISELDFSIPIIEMGLDSLGATQLARQLSDFTGLSLSSDLVFKYPTIEKLSTYVHDVISRDTLYDDKNKQQIIEKKGRVLFLHGGSGNADRIKEILVSRGWTTLLSNYDWFYPEAPNSSVRIGPVMLEYFGMQGMYEDVVSETSEKTMRWSVTSPPIKGLRDFVMPYVPNEEDWRKSEEYLTRFIQEKGPFNIIGGLSEGAATAAILVQMQAFFDRGDLTKGKNVGLDLSRVEMLLLMSGFCDTNTNAHLFDPLHPLIVPTLLLHGKQEPLELINDWFPQLRSCFCGPVVFEHPGHHVVPLVTKYLEIVVKRILSQKNEKK